MPTAQTINLLQGKLTLQLLPRMAYSANDPTQMETLGVSLEHQRGVHAIDSDRRVDFDTWPGVLAYTPRGVGVFSESAEGGEYLALRWTEGLVPQSGGASAHRRQMAGHADALRLGLNLRQQLLAPEVDWGAAEDLSLQFIGLHATREPKRRVSRKDAYGRVLDRIAAEFDQPLTLSTLATMVDATELVFLREFKACLGMTPHAYLVETRLQAARRLLEDGETPLADVASACGFAQQSHFGNAFRRSIGVTPRAYRQCFTCVGGRKT